MNDRCAGSCWRGRVKGEIGKLSYYSSAQINSLAQNRGFKLRHIQMEVYRSRMYVYG